MKKIRLIALSVLTVVLCSGTLIAQDFLGITTSNYAGVNKVNYNPASIADSRFKLDLNLFGFNFFTGNNYLGIDRKALFNGSLFNNSDSINKYLIRSTNKSEYNAYIGITMQLPSLMLTLSPKHSIALSGRVRSITNIEGLEQGILDLAWESFDLETNWNRNISQKRLNIQTNAWAEYGLTYGRVLLDKKKHFLKGGITAKLIQGIGTGYLVGKDLEYNFTNADTISSLNADVIYGYSSNFAQDRNNSSNYKFVFNPTVGFDFGFEYEWRPKYADYQYEMDGKSGLWKKDKNKYKLKVGFALTDLGFVRYDKAGESNRFVTNVKNLPVSTFDNVENFNTLDSIFNSEFSTNTDQNRRLRTALPTMLSFQVDYNIWKGLYLNFSPFISVGSRGSNNLRSNIWNNYALTPRYETRSFGIYLPNSYNMLTGFNSGISLRFGSFIVGSGTLFTNITKSAIREFDLHLIFKRSLLFKKPKDRDGDKVSDKVDKCNDIAGVWEFKGCPDTDRDGIQDSEDECTIEAGPKELRGCPDSDGDGIPNKSDECPSEPGLVEFKGCPDSDGDGIPDKRDNCPNDKGSVELNGCPDRDKDGIVDNKDDCPDEQGLPQFKGCPDTDGDGVIDKLDRCPNLPGSTEKFGCPDTDGDGISDNEDACPEQAGIPENKGCPFKDTDGDGIKDKDDKCPNQAGPIENGGCPYADTDADGVIDMEDKCPKTPGVKENSGCPQIAKEEQEVIKAAFDNLEFATGKAIMRNTSYTSLDSLGSLLKRKKEYKLLIEGHTDNVGKRQTNLTLSKNRATAVKTYLMKKGVPASRLLTNWYGPDKPIESNSTESGRQKNRRVEMTIVFE